MRKCKNALNYKGYRSPTCGCKMCEAIFRSTFPLRLRVRGKDHAKNEIAKLTRKKNRTIYEAAKLIVLRERVIVTSWDMELFKIERKLEEEGK